MRSPSDAEVSPLEAASLARRVEKLGALLEVAKAMTGERDLDALLALILAESAKVVEADRCTIFLVDRERKQLWSRLAQGAAQEIRVPIDAGIAGLVATTGQVVNIPDAYADPRFNRSVDLATGYRTHNIICCPMRDAAGEVAGVIQALNKAKGPFDAGDEELLLVLGGQAAAAVENAMLHGEIRELFEGFVKASVVAIESRDPTTAGHSGRVARLTVCLAESLARGGRGPYAGVRFSSSELDEIRYASLLHDFGKVGVREPVLVKAEKLFPFELELVRARFEVIARTMESDCLRRQLELLSTLGAAAAEPRIAEERERFLASERELEEILTFVTECNRPAVLARGGFERLGEIGARAFTDGKGRQRPFLTGAEVRSLSIPRGSLSDEERREIESHVSHTFRFLSQIPWTRALRRVPDIAHAHHEKLDGTGYPLGLPGERIPVQSRLMAISDIYDALTASDRPYKRAVPHALALDILEKDADAGKIDKDLLAIFVEAEVPRRALG